MNVNPPSGDTEPNGPTREDVPSGGRNAARSAATRGRLLAAARALFAERGFAAVGTQEIVRAAGVTRGALYHHFLDKEDLFLAVYEQVEADITGRLAEGAVAGQSPLELLEHGAQVFLDACREPEVQQIVLIDAPAVLGWDTWRAVGERHALGLVEGLLSQAMEVGEVERLPVRPLALLLIGAIDEAALWVVRADDIEAARAEVGRVVAWMVSALRR
jgi:AcrR family transcriptional regulator